MLDGSDQDEIIVNGEPSLTPEFAEFHDLSWFAPNMLFIPVFFTLLCNLMWFAARKKERLFRSHLNLSQQRKVTSSALELVLTLGLLVVIIVYGYALVLDGNRFSTHDFYVVRGAVLVPMLMFYVFKMTYRLTSHWTMYVHHCISLFFISFSLYTYDRNSVLVAKRQVLRLMYLYTIAYCLCDQVAILALLKHRLGHGNMVQWIRAATVVGVLVRTPLVSALFYVWAKICFDTPEAQQIELKKEWTYLFVPLIAIVQLSQIHGWSYFSSLVYRRPSVYEFDDHLVANLGQIVGGRAPSGSLDYHDQPGTPEFSRNSLGRRLSSSDHEDQSPRNGVVAASELLPAPFSKKRESSSRSSNVSPVVGDEKLDQNPLFNVFVPPDEEKKEPSFVGIHSDVADSDKNSRRLSEDSIPMYKPGAKVPAGNVDAGDRIFDEAPRAQPHFKRPMPKRAAANRKSGASAASVIPENLQILAGGAANVIDKSAAEAEENGAMEGSLAVKLAQKPHGSIRKGDDAAVVQMERDLSGGSGSRNIIDKFKANQGNRKATVEEVVPAASPVAVARANVANKDNSKKKENNAAAAAAVEVVPSPPTDEEFTDTLGNAASEESEEPKESPPAPPPFDSGDVGEISRATPRSVEINPVGERNFGRSGSKFSQVGLDPGAANDYPPSEPGGNAKGPGDAEEEDFLSDPMQELEVRMVSGGTERAAGLLDMLKSEMQSPLNRFRLQVLHELDHVPPNFQFMRPGRDRLVTLSSETMILVNEIVENGVIRLFIPLSRRSSDASRASESPASSMPPTPAAPSAMLSTPVEEEEVVVDLFLPRKHGTRLSQSSSASQSPMKARNADEVEVKAEVEMGASSLSPSNISKRYSKITTERLDPKENDLPDAAPIGTVSSIRRLTASGSKPSLTKSPSRQNTLSSRSGSIKQGRKPK